jgi:hypothetical protein
MDYTEKIEFYRHRNIGERLYVTAAFLKQTWKVILKFVLLPAIPLALITGYSMSYYYHWYSGIFTGGNGWTFPFQVVLFFLVSFVSQLVMVTITGAILIKYRQDELNPQTGWNELSQTLLSLIPKTLLIQFYLFLLSVFLVLAVVLLFTFAGMAAGIIFVSLILPGLLAIAPSMVLVLFPAYFNGNSARDSIKIAFSSGFKDWGGIFVAILISSVIAGIVSAIFGMPYQIMLMLKNYEITSSGFILASLSSLGNLLTYPFLFIYMAFQYFSIVEKEEGISMQSRIDEFDKL